MDRWLTGAVVIVGFEAVVETNSLQMGTNEFFSYLVRLVANKKHLQSCHYSHQNAIKAQRLLSCSSRGEPNRRLPSALARVCATPAVQKP